MLIAGDSCLDAKLSAQTMSSDLSLSLLIPPNRQSNLGASIGVTVTV